IEHAAHRDANLHPRQEVTELGRDVPAVRQRGGDAEAVIEVAEQADVRREAAGPERGRVELEPEARLRAGRERVRAQARVGAGRRFFLALASFSTARAVPGVTDSEGRASSLTPAAAARAGGGAARATAASAPTPVSNRIIDARSRSPRSTWCLVIAISPKF